MKIAKLEDVQEATVLSRKQGGTIQSYRGRGMWVPDGLTAAAIWAVGEVIAEEFGVNQFTAHHVATAALEAAKKAEWGT